MQVPREYPPEEILAEAEAEEESYSAEDVDPLLLPGRFTDDWAYQQWEQTDKSRIPRLVRWKLSLRSWWTQRCSWKTAMMPLMLLSLVVLGTAGRVVFTLMLYEVHNYPFMLTQLTTFLFVPLMLPVVLWQKWRGTLSESELAFPKHKFAIMGAMDCGGMMIGMVSAVHLTGFEQVIIGQGAMPVVMIMSYFVLRHRYHVLQYLGASVILGGIVLSLLQSLDEQNKPGHHEAVRHAVVAWCIVYFMSNIPAAASAVYKEMGFGEADMGAFYLNFWVAFFQFFIGLPFAPLAAWVQDLAMADIVPNVTNGLRCVFTGSDSMTICNPGQEGLDKRFCCMQDSLSDGTCILDSCAHAPRLLFMYMALNVASNVVMVLVLKHGSATLLVISGAVVIPLSNVAFTIPFVMGRHAKPLSAMGIVGLCVVLLGLVLYRAVDRDHGNKFHDRNPHAAATAEADVDYSVAAPPPDHRAANDDHI